MGLRVIQYQRQSHFTAVEECPLLMEMNPSHTSLYSLMVGEVGGLCLPSRLKPTSVHSLLWHAEAFFFQGRNGGNDVTCPQKENQGPVFTLSFKKGVSEI